MCIRDRTKEAKTLAKLAKYKHETSGAGGDVDVSKTETDVSFENEEISRDNEEPDETISKEDLAALLLKHMRSN